MRLAPQRQGAMVARALGEEGVEDLDCPRKVLVVHRLTGVVDFGGAKSGRRRSRQGDEYGRGSQEDGWEPSEKPG